MNKPLTKKKLLEVNRALNGELSLGHRSELFTEVAGAEAYWREAVKNHPPKAKHSEVFGVPFQCEWCGGEGDECNMGIHKPDCPWLLAQESV